MILKRFFWLSLYFVVLKISAKQLPYYQVYNELNGFKAKSIRKIAESENGKIWIATEQGLWNFDGFQFKQFKSSDDVENPLMSNDIQHIFIDQYQNLWIGYYQHGISIWNLKTGKRKNLHNFIQTKELNSNRVTGISCIKDKVYVFFHDSAWLEFNPKNYEYQLIKPKAKTGTLPLLFRQIVYSQQFNKYFLASSDGMFLFDEVKKTIESKAYKINNKPVWKIHNSINGLLVKDSIIWQNTWGGGMLKYNIKSDSFEACYQYNAKEQFSGATNTIFSVQWLNNNELYIATPDFGIGVFNTQTGKYEFFDVEKQESSAYANLIYKDSKSNFWIGSEIGLINLINDYQNLYQKMELPKSPNPTMQRLNFNYFVFEYQNKIITGSIQGSGVYVYNKTSLLLEKIIRFPNLKNNQTFRTLQAFEYNGTLFINSWSGLFQLNINNEQWKRFDFFGNKTLEQGIYRCVRLRNKQLLLGFHDSKVAWFDLESKASIIWTEKDVINEQVTFSGSQIYELELDVNQNIIATHEGGFLVLNTKNKSLKQFSALLDNSKSMFKVIAHVLTDPDGFIWMSSAEAGLLKIDPKNNYKVIKVFNEENGLFGNGINDMSIDQYGCIWGLQDNNIFRLDVKSELLSNWNKDNGIQLDPAGWGVIKAIGDQIFYGRLNEIIVVNQKKLTRQLNYSNKFYIDKIKNHLAVYHQYNYPKYLFLNHDKNSLHIAIGSQNILLNKHNKLKYRLKNNQEWVLIENLNEIHVSNLAPGTYDFEISFINNLQNKWSSPISLFKFKVKAPFYQQWWFVLSMILMIGAVFYYFYRVNNQKKQLKNDFEMKLNELKMEALRSQMNPHFIFNSLNSINYYIIKNDTENASNYLKKFSKLVRLILNHSKAELVTLQEEIDINKLYVELEQMRFNQSFDFEVFIHPSIETEEIILPSMLLQPFIENAVWHGLMHKKEKGRLKIEIKPLDNNKFVISITDNGIGRKAALELKSKTATTQKSHGMGITFERIKIYNKLQHHWIISQDSVDLFDDHQSASGTQINLTFSPKSNES